MSQLRDWLEEVFDTGSERVTSESVGVQMSTELRRQREAAGGGGGESAGHTDCQPFTDCTGMFTGTLASTSTVKCASQREC